MISHSSTTRSILIIVITSFLSASACTGIIINDTDSSKDVGIYANGTDLHPVRVSTSYDEASLTSFAHTKIVTQSSNTSSYVNGSEDVTIKSADRRRWCVAKQYADSDALQVALDWVCGFGAADCRPIQLGQSCYVPNTVCNHASYAFNSYYQIRQHASGTCDFDGVATVTYEDPSYAGCLFPFRVGQVGANADGADVRLSMVIATALLVSIFTM